MSISPRDFVISYNRLYECYHPLYTVIPIITTQSSSSISSSSSSSLYNEYKLLDYEYHSHRLKKITNNIRNNIDSTSNDNSIDDIILKVCKNEIATKINNNNNKYNYGLITICCHYDDSSNNFQCNSMYSSSIGYNYFNIINDISNSDNYIADMYMHKRVNPILKSCSWPEERMYIEKQKDTKSIETILYHEYNHDDCILTEGLTSNLYCLDNNGKKMYTASSELVLPGSMGYIVESVCRSIGIEIIHEALPLSVIVKEGFDLFLTSATKPVQKLTTLIHPNKVTRTDLPSHESISGKSIRNIRISVLDEIRKRFNNATPI